MTLADLRKVSVKRRLRIRFSLSNGMECVLNEHGVAQVPELRAVPSFNLEDELQHADRFLVEPAGPATREKTRQQPRSYSRDEMNAMLTAGASGEAIHEEHDE